MECQHQLIVFNLVVLYDLENLTEHPQHGISAGKEYCILKEKNSLVSYWGSLSNCCVKNI